MTKISSLASLLILYKTNSAVDNNDTDFFSQSGKEAIYECFDAVTIEHIVKCPQEFREDMDGIHDYQFQWPSKSCLNNSFQYFRQQYVTNLQTNLNMHCENRLKHFLRIRCFELNSANPVMAYDGTDIRNILKDVMKDENWTNGDAMRQQKVDILWQALIQIGFPANTNLKQYVKIHWFRSIWPFMKIQRYIEEFLINHADEFKQWCAFNKDRKNNTKPTGIRPPTVRNFSVIPLCNFHLKHIKIDITDCYLLASKFKAIPTYINPITGRSNKVPKGYYTDEKLPKEVKAARKRDLFDILFDMDKIRRNGKQSKTFHGQIDTDGISASVIYEPAQRFKFFCLLMILCRYMNGFFRNVIGIDPGDNTWLAGVRREMPSLIEVSIVRISLN